MAHDFKGKTILVTGAGAGIGKAITQKLVSCGAKVIAVSLLKSELDALVQELPSVRAIQADLRDWDGTKKALSELGRVDGLVNNAGVCLVAPFVDITQEQIDLTFDINVKGLINVSQIIAKSMIENDIKGSIVNVSSIAALTSLTGGTAYCGSKGAVQAITRVMAADLGRKGIRVNSVNPTVVKTELARFIWESEEITNGIKARTPFGRFAKPEEIADAVAFLLSDQASMINGIPLPIDGGYLVYIGKAITHKLAGYGAKIIAVSLLQSELDELKKELPSVCTIQANLGRWDETRNALSGLGRVDGLVNNAGVAFIAPLLEVTEEEYDNTFDVNVKGLLNVSQIIAKSMVENGVKGSIVNLSSICALRALPASTVYCGSKGAVQAITGAMALELGKEGIRVNSVNPTAVKTNLARFVWESEKNTNAHLARTPLGRFAEAEEVADAVAFLLSDQASMITGALLPIDGGFLV